MIAFAVDESLLGNSAELSQITDGDRSGCLMNRHRRDKFEEADVRSKTPSPFGFFLMQVQTLKAHLQNRELSQCCNGARVMLSEEGLKLAENRLIAGWRNRI